MTDSVSKRTRISMLIAAGAILVVALAWLVLLESNSYTRAVCRRLGGFGYSVSPSDFYTQGYGSGVSIGEVIGKDCSEPVSLSKQAGFGADIEKKGLVELMLWNMDNDSVMYCWLLDREPQLVFIESLSTGLLRSITDKK